MTASIFFTERLPGISIFQSVASSAWRLTCSRWLFEGLTWRAACRLSMPMNRTIRHGPPKPVSRADFQAGFLARVRLPQKQGLCQVGNAPDFETLSGF